MHEKELRVRELFVKMLEDAAKYTLREKYYAEDMKDFHEVVQWNFGPIKGYQVFDETEYSFKIDEEIEDPTLVLGCTDLDLACQFLNNEFRHWPAFGKTDFLVATKGADGSSADYRGSDHRFRSRQCPYHPFCRRECPYQAKKPDCPPAANTRVSANHGADRRPREL